MKLKWYGHSCFGMTFADGTVLVTDPFDESVGYPLCTASADAVLSSHDHFDHNHIQSLSGHPRMINAPGSYTAGEVRIEGTASWHDPEQGRLRGPNTIFQVFGDGLKLVHLGDLGHMPNEEQLEALSGADVMLIPIGGNFTIDTKQAVEIIRLAKPRTAIAMHFRNQWCSFPVSDEKEFVELTGASVLPNELEIMPDSVLPAAGVMQYA